MNEQEKKLREAAEEYANELIDSGAIKNYENTWMQSVFQYIVKSESALEYWESQRAAKEVDLEAIKKDWYSRCNYLKTKGVDVDAIWNTFLPHLQPAQSDAIEFADWLNNEFYIPSEDGLWRIMIEHTEFTRKKPKVNIFTIEQLYTEFQQSKTNGDENS